MTDIQLRRAERLASSQADPRHEARLLVEQLRHGQLDPARVELAAPFGDPPAQIALGQETDTPWTSPSITPAELWEAVLALERFGRRVLVEVGIVAAELAQPVWELTKPGDPIYERLLATAREWLACPCEQHYQAAYRLTFCGPLPSPYRGAGFTSRFACSVVSEPTVSSAARCAAVATILAVEATCCVAAVRNAVRHRLLGWARTGHNPPHEDVRVQADH